MQTANKNLLKLISHLERSGVLKNPRLKKALEMIDRYDFVPDQYKQYAYEDRALPITEGQTISQPTTVVFMLELLNPEPNEKILDIGAGSGWVSALLSQFVQPKGKVYAIEINEMVGSFGQNNIKKFGSKNIHYEITNATSAWEQYAPYDKIHSGAAFKKVPNNLPKTLNIKGRLVAPTQTGFVENIERVSEKKFRSEKHYGFSFVPFIE